jgi:hypothetical protein
LKAVYLYRSEYGDRIENFLAEVLPKQRAAEQAMREDA